MKRVLLFLGSVLGLIFITSICLEIFGFYDSGFTITLYKPMWMILLIIFGVSIGAPFLVFLIISSVRVIKGLFNPNFVRIADNLENAINRKKNINYKLNIPQKRDLLAEKMLRIWRKADMQYPLSELDFERLKGGKSSD